jgi:ribosomal protein L18E
MNIAWRFQNKKTKMNTPLKKNAEIKPLVQFYTEITSNRSGKHIVAIYRALHADRERKTPEPKRRYATG